MTKIILLSLAAITLSACGAAEEEMEAEFRTSFVESCVESSVKAGGPEDASQAVCDCAADKVIEEKGIKLAMTPNETNDILDRCIAETGAETQG